MTRVVRAGALLALVWGMALSGSAAVAGDKPPTTIGVRNGVTEFSFSLSRTRVDPGQAIIQYHNTGEDPHDLNVRRRGTDVVLATGVTDPGDFNNLPVSKLKAESKYLLWCSLDGHRQAGMEATLKVRKKRRN